MRLAIACILLIACGHPATHGDQSDGGPDAPPDAWVPDTTPPALVTTTPTGAAWLHEPVRLVFDEPLGGIDVTVTATLANAPVTATATIDGNAIAVAIDPDARGVGALALHVEGTVTDAAGNAGPVAADVQVTLPPWNDGALGDAASPPVVIVDSRGAVFGAWIAGNQLVAGVQYGGTWQPLGAPLGSAAASPAIALDPMQSLLVGWIDQGTAHVARFTSGAWQELPSPGTGDAIALASPPMGGNPVAAVFGTSATVVELDGGTWQPIGATVPIASRTGEPALAVGSAGHPAIGWIDGNRIRVYRYDGSWTAIAPIALPAPPSGTDHVSLAMRGGMLVVAYDAWSGSFGVLAAKVTGTATAWTRLDHLLDLDAQSDAVTPAVAIDATGAPVVAWTEFVDGMRERGLISRWTGSKWQIAAGTPWLRDPDAQPSRPSLALYAGGAPVVAWTADGHASLARFNGPGALAMGMSSRSSIAGCSFDPNNPPQLLSATGCFTMTTAGQPTAHPGLVPYSIGVQLWTDGAKKRRWIGLPDGQKMTNSSTGAWAAPNGTIIIKEFAYERTPGKPMSRRAMETRILAKDASGWRGFSYQWNTAGTDATLLTDGEWTKSWPLDDGTSHTHLYPSRSECLSCHQSSYGPLLGIRGPQLARYVEYDGVIADQLATLAAIGVGPPTTATPFVSPHDASETYEHRMRGYMAANCAHCHNPNDIAVHDLRYTTPLAQTNLCPDIVPGNPGASRTYQLVSSRPGMPPLGTLQTDPIAVSTLYSWIAGMTSCP
jgi:hypothetical protein